MHAFEDEQYVVAELDRHIVIRQTRVLADERMQWEAPFRGKLLAVAGGLPGAGTSEVASTATIDGVLHYITSAMPWIFAPEDSGSADETRERALDNLRHVLARCENRLRRAAEKRGVKNTQNITITLAYILWPDLYVIDSGYGCCYLYRGDRLHHIAPERTSTHRLRVASISERQSPRSAEVDEHAITSTGGDETDVHHVTLVKGDRILLCTRGLAYYLDDEEIARYLSANRPSSAVCERLVASAREIGGADNITAVVCRCE